MPTPDQLLIRCVNDPTIRRAVFDQARVLLPKTGARCATTAALYCIQAGIFQRWRSEWVGTLAFAKALLSKGWKVSRILDLLEPGYICFTEDTNPRNGRPDHTYIFVRWLDREKGVAEIVDNYKVDPHARNILKPCRYMGIKLAYGKLDYFLIPRTAA